MDTPDAANDTHALIGHTVSCSSLMDAMHLSGHVGDGYTFLRELGSGYQATVWLASKARELYAIKVLKRGNGITEIETLMGLSQPHIIKVEESILVKNCPALVTEFCRGGTLLDEVTEIGALSPLRLLSVARQLLCALSYLHELGLTHRDIKPSNILYRDVGRSEVVLADFGFAGPRDSSGLVGTALFFAPEMIIGEEEWCPRAADVWSLGLSLAWAANGFSPYRSAETRRELALKIAHGEVELRPDLDHGVQVLLSWMLQKNPKRRPSAMQLQQIAARFLTVMMAGQH